LQYEAKEKREEGFPRRKWKEQNQAYLSRKRDIPTSFEGEKSILIDQKHEKINKEFCLRKTNREARKRIDLPTNMVLKARGGGSHLT